MCRTIQILISNWPRTQNFSQLSQAGKTVAFDFAHHGHALLTLYVQFLYSDCLISYRAGAWHYRIFPAFFKKSSFNMADSQRIVRVKTRTKAFFFEEILFNIPSENLPKLSKERMQYFCHALKLNLRSRHSAASASDFSMNGSFEPKIIINFIQQRILCLILPASVK